MRITNNNGAPVVSPEEQDHFFATPRREPCVDALTEILGAGKKKKGAVIKLHLEDFKAFNDTFGYEFGGRFLQEISRFLCMIEGADVYRVAGVEYIVILEDLARPVVEQVLENIIDRFDRSWQLSGMDCMCAVNIGLCWFPGYSETADGMLEDLSHAVSESALMGQNQVVVYDTDLMQKILRKNTLARKIPEALQSGAVELRYRPTWNVEKERFTRADCYIRMLDSEFGIIPYQEFISIAEQSGQIGAVSQYSIRKTCELIASFMDAGKEFESIAVPISPIQFLQERFAQDVEIILQETAIPAEKLAFEITDILAMRAFSSAQTNLGALSDLGVEIVLTEFGTGYSGLNNILDMPVDVVKLERLLIWQLDNDPRGAHLAEGLIHIAKNLGVKLIAEGVETETQVAQLKKFGCMYEQGFYYSPTLAASELEDCFQAMNA